MGLIVEITTEQISELIGREVSQVEVALIQSNPEWQRLFSEHILGWSSTCERIYDVLERLGLK